MVALLPVQALSNTVWAFSKLDVVDAELFAGIVGQVLDKMPKFNAQNIANTVCACENLFQL